MHDFMQKVKKVIFVEVASGALASAMKVIFPVLVVAGDAFLVYQGKMSVGMVVTSYTLVQNLVDPLNNLGDAYQGRQQALGSAERVYDYLFGDNPEEGKLDMPSDVDQLEVAIDSYSWGDKEVLHQLSLNAKTGDFVFISGDSGCGKSTLLKLICGLYPIENGNIYVNNRNIADISKHSYYKGVQMLFQDAFLFEGTIEENLTLGDEYPAEKIQEALRISCMDEFVKEHGMDYEIKESGGNLSGGQRQRLCIARVLLREPSILLLDESTSALDKETEAQILESLREFMKKHPMMILAVSHNREYAGQCTQIWEL